MRITLGSQLTCVDVEQELGLSRGEVKKIATSSDGPVQVELQNEPTLEQKEKLEKIFSMKIKEIK
jgi:hypothetical protein